MILGKRFKQFGLLLKRLRATSFCYKKGAFLSKQMGITKPQLNMRLSIHIFTLCSLFAMNECCYAKPNIATYRQEASAFCELHSTKHWTSFTSHHTDSDSVTEKQLLKELDKRVKKVILTPAFNRIVNELNEIQFRAQLYPEAQKLIGQLIQQPWICPNYEKFYSLSSHRVSPATGRAETHLKIELHKHSVSVAGQEIKSWDLDALRQVIAKRQQAGQLEDVKLVADKPVKAEAIAAVFKLIGSMGLKSISLDADDDQLHQLRKLLGH